jgi:hypothetical protein
MSLKPGYVQACVRDDAPSARTPAAMKQSTVRRNTAANVIRQAFDSIFVLSIRKPPAASVSVVAMATAP